jgi:hypothetical protein
MAKARKDITGMRFGRLTVTRRAEDRVKYGRRMCMWECKCDCGNTKIAYIGDLSKGNIKSCGCLHYENAKEQSKLTNKKECVEGTRLCNLNAKTRKDNKSGYKGVFFDKRDNLWVAYITISKKRVYLGWFKDYEKAVKARKEAEDKYFTPVLERYGRAEDG